MKRTNGKKSRTDRPTLPELDQTKRSVLNSLTSLQSRRSYQHAMDEFIEWYCSEPRLALNRGIVLGYPAATEAKSSRPQPLMSGSPLFVGWPTRQPTRVCSAQNFTVDGLTADDTVIVNPPGTIVGPGIVGARVRASDTLAITFANTTTSPLCPASGLDKVYAFRK